MIKKIVAMVAICFHTAGYCAEQANDVSLHNKVPAYPKESRENKEEGVVVLSVLVTKEGLGEDIQMKQSSGFPRLDQAAIDAVQTWHFIPAKRNGEPIDFRYDVPINFKLN